MSLERIGESPAACLTQLPSAADVLSAMRRVGVAALVMFTLVFDAASAGGALPRRRTSSRCPQAHAHPVLADAHVVIYTVHEAVKGPYETEHFIVTRVCAYGHPGSFKIAEHRIPEPTEGWGGGAFHVTLDGSMVAYEKWKTSATRYYQEGEPLWSTWRVIVRDARTGRIVRAVPTGTAQPAEPWFHFVGDGKATMIVLKGDGSVGWITDTEQENNRYEVHAADHNGSRVLATGDDIDPNSLALAGSTLYWTQEGKPMSARLD